MLEHALLGWVVRHGYGALFSLLVVGIVGLPVPDEVLLTYAGALAHDGRLSLPAVGLVAFGGSMCGISLSYLLGRLPGARIVGWLGPRLGITAARLSRTERWFEHWGKWTLVVGYFVPGIRHLTAIVAGTTGLRFRSFAAFAYLGALLWSMSFVLLGYLVGDRWRMVAETVHRHALGAALLVGFGLVAYVGGLIVHQRLVARPAAAHGREPSDRAR